MKVVDPGGQLFERRCVCGRVRDLFLLGLAACGPRWVDAREQPFALAEAVSAAKLDHRCENVVPRCDASHGMTWEFEVDACGRIERYAVTDETTSEADPECDQAICPSPSPPCRTAMRGTWWAVETHAPERCDDAMIDDALRVELDRSFVRLAADGRRDVSASCTDPSFMISIDGRWFALCGSLPRAAVDEITIESGLMVGAGAHEAYAVYLQPGGCVRSRAEAIPAHRPIPWLDL
jgi:hypothetical protein